MPEFLNHMNKEKKKCKIQFREFLSPSHKEILLLKGIKDSKKQTFMLSKHPYMQRAKCLIWCQHIFNSQNLWAQSIVIDCRDGDLGLNDRNQKVMASERQ